MIENNAIRRAVLWHQRHLLRRDTPLFYELRIDNSRRPVGDMDVRFHTYACLFPARNQYIAVNTGDWHDGNITAAELRRIISTATVSQKKIAEQRKLMVEQFGAAPLRIYQWKTAMSLAEAYKLPIGFYAVGNTPEGKRVVFLCVLLSAPLDMMIAKFKKATPNIHFD